MNDLKEIGGFIVSADPYVNHDNSLSGNGTLTSPLGVVPGYNETVLWSGNGTQTTGSLNLSESTSGFERIGISFFGDTSPQVGYQEFPIHTTSDSFPIITCDPHMEGGSTFSMYIKFGLITQSNNGSTLNLVSGGYNNIYGSTKGAQASCNWTKPFKIVGINRKQ